MAHSHTPGGHDHAHSHAPVTSANERKVLISFGLVFVFMIVEAVGGVLSGSLALLADAGHMLTDAVALALSYAAFRIGRRAADSRRTFGYLRLEVLAGFLNAVTLFAIVGWIVYEAVTRLQEPGAVLAGPMLLVAVAGLFINILVLWIMTRGETEHVNVKGAILHVMGDLLGSVGAIVAAIVISATGWTPIDPILSVVVSLLILRSAWTLLGKSVHILLEGAPDDVDPAEIERALTADVPDLAAVRHVHVWQITSGRSMATLNVRPTEDGRAPDVARATAEVLRTRFGIEHATVAIDWNDRPADPCSLEADADAQDGGHVHGPVEKSARALTVTAPALSHGQLALLAEAFRLLGDPTRLRIVMYCLDGPKSVGDIAASLALSQTLVSHHLRLLRSAHLLAAERRSRHVFYALADSHVSRMIADMAEHVTEDRAHA